MKRFQSIVMASVAVLLAVACVVPAPTASAVSSSAALSIVPKKNYTIEPGKSVDDTLVIRNLDTKLPLELSLRVVDFTFTDDGGTPKLMLDKDAPLTTWSLKPFLNVEKSVTIPPSSSQSVDMSVSIPKGHGAGSYYSAIVYSSGEPNNGGNVGLSASGVTLVFTSIPGKVNEDLKLKKFGAYIEPANERDSGYKFFTTTEPIQMAYTLENNGNVTESPVGSIKLHHIFGKEYTISNINPNSSLALIGQTRTFTTCIKRNLEKVDFNGTRAEASQCVSPGLWPGIYSASLDLYYGQNGNNTQEIVKSTIFIYMPMWFILVSLVVLAILGYFIWKLVRKIRHFLYGPQGKSKKSKSPRRK